MRSKKGGRLLDPYFLFVLTRLESTRVELCSIFVQEDTALLPLSEFYGVRSVVPSC